MRSRPMIAAALLLLLNAPLSALAAALSPDPSLSPREVVEAQLAALKRVDVPQKDAGFAVVFRFTSPENRGQTGPLPRFSKMLREGFGEMINHKAATLPPTFQQADEALQAVELTSLAGRTYRYVFVLRRQQQGEFRGCWMTDGVVPQEEGGSSQEL